MTGRGARTLTVGLVLVLLALGVWVPLASAGAVQARPSVTTYAVWFTNEPKGGYTGLTPFTPSLYIETNGSYATGTGGCVNQYLWGFYAEWPSTANYWRWCGPVGNPPLNTSAAPSIGPFTYIVSSPTIYTAYAENQVCPNNCPGTAPIKVDTHLWANTTLSANGTRPGTPVTVGVTTQGGADPRNDSYAWSLNGSSYPAGNVSSFSFTPAGAGNYTFAVNATDPWGQYRDNRTVLEVLPPLPPPPQKPLSANVTLSDYRVQNGTTVTATATLKNATSPSYLWTTNGTTGLGCSGATCSLSEPHGATYEVNLTVTDGTRTAWSQAPLKVWSNYTTSPAPPTVSVALSGNQTYPGTPVWLNATATGGAGTLGYTWTLNGSAYGAAEPSLRVVPKGAGNYTFAATVTDGWGRSAVSRAILEVLPNGSAPPPSPLVVSLTANRTAFHAGGGVTLTASATGGVSPYAFVWSLNGTNATLTGGTETLTLAHAGNYTYRVWATDTKGDVAQSTATTIEVLPLWTGGTNPPPCTTGCSQPPPKTQPPTLVSTLGSPVVLLPLIAVGGVVVAGLWYVRRRRAPQGATKSAAATSSVVSEDVAPPPPTSWDEGLGAEEPEEMPAAEPEYDPTWVKEEQAQQVQAKHAEDPEPEPEVKVEEPTLGSLTAADVNPQAKPLPKSVYQAFSADVRGDTAHVTEIGGEAERKGAEEKERIEKVLATRKRDKAAPKQPQGKFGRVKRKG